MKLSKQALIGYPAGVVTGVTYGLNPLFAVPLMAAGAAVSSILFFVICLQWFFSASFYWLRDIVLL